MSFQRLSSQPSRLLLGLFAAIFLVGPVVTVRAESRVEPQSSPPPTAAPVLQISPELLQQLLTLRAAKELHLTEPQQDQLRTLLAQMDKTNKLLEDSRVSLQQALIAAMQGKTFDRLRLHKVFAARQQRLKEQTPALIGAIADFFDDLDETQQQRARALLTPLVPALAQQ